MNVLVQFGIAQSGHPGFPLVAEGFLHTPDARLRIIEYGRSESEIYERVFGFAQMQTRYPNGNGAITREAFLAVHMRDNKHDLL